MKFYTQFNDGIVVLFLQGPSSLHLILITMRTDLEQIWLQPITDSLLDSINDFNFLLLIKFVWSRALHVS